MRIGDRVIGPGHPPYVIAELGVNHDGGRDRALQLVEAAHRAGADAVKLQWFEADRLLSRVARLARYQTAGGANDAFELLHGLELDAGVIAEAARRAAQMGLHTIATVFSVDHVEPAVQCGLDAFKTASPDIVNRPLIEALASTGRPLLVSTGAATMAEVEAVSAWLGKADHVLMHCVSAYPTPDALASLAGRAAMSRVNPNALGYSDHTTAEDTGAAGRARAQARPAQASQRGAPGSRVRPPALELGEDLVGCALAVSFRWRSQLGNTASSRLRGHPSQEVERERQSDHDGGEDKGLRDGIADVFRPHPFLHQGLI